MFGTHKKFHVRVICIQYQFTLCYCSCELLIYILNRSGPRILPCDTPRSTRWISYTSPFIYTHCRLSEKYDLNHLRLLTDNLMCSSFPRSISWFIEANASDLSRNSIPVTFPPSMASGTEFFKWPTACTIMPLRLKPYWCLYHYLKYLTYWWQHRNRPINRFPPKNCLQLFTKELFEQSSTRQRQLNAMLLLRQRTDLL